MRAVCGLMVAAAALSTGCGASGPTTGAMAEALTQRLLPEEKQVQSVCAQLELSPVELSTRAAVADSAKNGSRALKALRAELIANYSGLLKSLDVTSECKPEAIIDARLRSEDTEFKECREVLSAALDSAKGALGKPKHRIWAALNSEKFADAKALLANPVAAAQLVDFSPALLAASLELANGSEQLVDDLASNFSWAQGLVRMGLRIAAAEAVAWTFDTVVSELEQQKLVNPASVARAACSLHRDAPRGAVAARVVKRAVLRMAAHQWGTQSYPLDSFCEELGSGKTCVELRQRVLAKGDDEEEAMSRPLSPQIGNFDWEARTEEAAVTVSNALKEATELCKIPQVTHTEAGEPKLTYSEAPCNFRYLSDVASILVLHNMKADKDRAAIDRKLTELGERLETKLRAVDSRLEQMQADFTKVHEVASRLEDSALQLARQNNDMLTMHMKCDQAKLDARRARVAFATAALKFCGGAESTSSLCGLSGASDADADRRLSSFCASDAGPLTRALPNGGALVVKKQQLCDVSNTEMRIDLQTDSAFGPCSTDLRSNAAKDIASLLSQTEFSSEGTTIEIVGHADEQKLGADCTTRIGVKGDEGNKRLSEQRARAVFQLLTDAKAKSNASLGFTLAAPRGVGDSQPSTVNCADLPTEETRQGCHARNRRITFAVSKPKEFRLSVLNCQDLVEGRRGKTN